MKRKLLSARFPIHAPAPRAGYPYVVHHEQGTLEESHVPIDDPLDARSRTSLPPVIVIPANKDFPAGALRHEIQIRARL